MSRHSGFTAEGPVDFTGSNHAGLKVNSLTTVQRDALTPANGMLIYNTTNTRFEKYENGAWGPTGGAASGDVSSNTSSSVDSEIALFSGTGGKTIKRATLSGLLKAASGVIAAA